MKKLSLLLCLALLVSMFTVPAVAEELPHLEITWAGHADTTPPAEDGTPFQKYLEEKWNVTIVPQSITHMEMEAWNLFFASGNTCDYISNPGSGYNMLIDQGLVRPIPYEWLETYAPNWMAKTYAMVGSEELTRQMLTYTDGNVYAMPYIAYTAAFAFGSYIRTDWLEAVGKEIPTTLDELHDVIKAFVENDPDGNGVADTLGFSGTNGAFHYIFGAYGIMKDTYNADEAGTVTFTSVQDAYKEALKTLQAWYKEGLIDPETFTDDRAKLREKWSSGRIGIMDDNAWWGESARGNNSVFSMLQNRNPEAEITFWNAPKGPEGLSGARYSIPGVTGQACILFGADATDEEVIRILQIKESMSYIDEYKKARYGEEGVHYTVGEDGVLVMNPEWDFEQQRAAGIGQFYATQPQSIEDVGVVLNAHDIEIQNISLANNKIYSGTNFFVPSTNEAKQTYGADVDTIVKEYYANAITGKIDIDATWDEYVKSVYDAGLDKIIADYEAMLK